MCCLGCFVESWLLLISPNYISHRHANTAWLTFQKALPQIITADDISGITIEDLEENPVAVTLVVLAQFVWVLGVIYFTLLVTTIPSTHHLTTPPRPCRLPHLALQCASHVSF